MTSSIQVKRDTATNWRAANRVLLSGEIGLESDTKLVKIGDGTTPWVTLRYLSAVSSGLFRGAADIVGTLQTGMSACLSLQGDSTGVNTSLADTPRRWFALLAANIAAALPGIHVLYKAWDDPSQEYKAWYTIQAGTLGRRYLLFTGSTGAGNRSRQQSNAQIGDFTGDVDFRVNVAPDSWTPAAIQTLLARNSGVGARGWYLQLNASGGLTLQWYPVSGSETFNTVTATSAQVAGTDGVAMWIRATIVLATGVATLYKSVDDGQTWTTLNTATVGATTIGQPAGVFYEVGGRGTSTNVLSGKVYETQLRNGIAGPIMDFQCVENWSTTSACVLGGSPTLYVMNGSFAGQGMAYFSDATRFPRMIIPCSPGVQYLNTGHNENASRGLVMTGLLDTWLAMIKARAPLSNVCIAIQNPEVEGSLANASNANARTREIGVWALKNALGIVDNGAAIGRTGNIPGYTAAYFVHPLDIGYALMGLEAVKPYLSVLT